MREEIKKEIILTIKAIITTCAFVWLLCSGIVMAINLTGFLKYLGYFNYFFGASILYFTFFKYFKMEEKLLNYKLNDKGVSATN